MTTTASNAVRLYRSMLRESRRFKDYNVKAYVTRRTRDAFRAPVAPEALDAAFRQAERDLAVLRRCAALSELYPSSESVMEHRLGVHGVPIAQDAPGAPPSPAAQAS